MLNPEKINKLDDYFYNRSSHDKKKELEQELEQNPDFDKEASVFFSLFSGFKALEVEALDHKMSTWEEKHQKTTAYTKIIKLKKFFKYASAAILILAFLPLGYQYLNGEMSSEDLFEYNFKPISNATDPFSSRGTPKKLDVIFTEGISSYNKGDYNLSIIKFNSYLESANNRVDLAEFYLAVSYLATGEFNKAKPFFEKGTKNTAKKQVKEASEWYLVLTLIKEKNIEQAQNNLTKIINKKKAHAFKEKALKLQQQIDKYYVP